MRTAIILAAFSLVGCATGTAPPAPLVPPAAVQVPITVKCAADPGPEPAYAATPGAIRGAADIYARTQLLLATIEQQRGYIAKLKAANSGCR